MARKVQYDSDGITIKVESPKYILIDYEEYQELLQCKNLLANIHNVEFNYPPSIEKRTMYLYSSELFEYLIKCYDCRNSDFIEIRRS